MVTRKPLPHGAALDRAGRQAQPQPQQQRLEDEWHVFGNPPDDGDWRDQPQRHQYDAQGLPQSGTAFAPHQVPSPPRPGPPAADYASFDDQDNVWVDHVPESSSTAIRVPSVLRPGARGQQDAAAAPAVQGGGGEVARVPTVLRPGGATKPETNPFKRKMPPGASMAHGGGRAQSPSDVPPVPPIPVDAFSQLGPPEQSNNPWQPALDGNKELPHPLIPELAGQEIERGVWDSPKPSRQPTPHPKSNSPTLMSIPSEEGSAGWEDVDSRKEPATKSSAPPVDQEVLQDAHAWDDLGSVKGKGLDKNPVVVTAAEAAGAGDEWNMIDSAPRPGPPSRRSTWENFGSDRGSVNGDQQNTSASKPERESDNGGSELAPRQTPALPPRPVDTSETYQIKSINWYDASTTRNPRASPILVQNANGPCPLVALVNALSLTTPANKSDSGLVGIMRSREQISLGLLIEAVFEELMSEGRMKPGVDFPDVGELNEFLQGLHTGMNVNPRFIPTPDKINAFKRASTTHLCRITRADMIPGTFEDTKAMDLYATFSIPLIHGWLPSRDDAAYAAFAHQASSYEDAQDLLIRECELEDKLMGDSYQGLTEEEQQNYQDILTIKSFLSITATQLTPWGLEVAQASMKPGSVAIFFRNDHFSTLYKHPQTLGLFTLVTDAGYAGHAEVVWESLVDINGERAEFFSGDFRAVGGASHGDSGGQAPPRSMLLVDEPEHGSSSAARSSHGRGSSQSQSQRPSDPPLSPKHEQEDHDLALALQLQEEEDERARAEQDRRRREAVLSEQFIEQQGRPPGPNSQNSSLRGGGRGGGGAGGRGRAQSPMRSSGAVNGGNCRNGPHNRGGGPGGRGGSGRPASTQQQTVRSLLPPVVTASTAAGTTGRPRNRGPDEGLDDAPPSYEQASRQTAYVPPSGHPAHPDAASSSATLASSATGGSWRGSGPGPGPAGGASGVRYPGATAAQGGRLRQGVPPSPSSAAVGGKDRDCVVM